MERERPWASKPFYFYFLIYFFMWSRTAISNVFHIFSRYLNIFALVGLLKVLRISFVNLNVCLVKTLIYFSAVHVLTDRTRQCFAIYIQATDYCIRNDNNRHHYNNYNLSVVSCLNSVVVNQFCQCFFIYYLLMYHLYVAVHGYQTISHVLETLKSHACCTVVVPYVTL